MAEKQNIPEIRFEGFTDPWEQRKFSDVAVIRRGLTYSPTNIVDGADGVRVLRSSNINEDHFVLNDDDVFVDESAVNIDLVHDGDILITAANGSPRLVGKRARISDLPGKTVHGGFMFVASSPCSDFLCASMGSSWYRRFLATGVAGGNGAIGNLDSKALGETIIAVPNDAEIDKLGNFFTRLDSLITLHQRKYDKLCTVKKSMLDKMFPKPGETEPEIRFEGYTDPWEQRKLGELCTISKGHGYSKADIRDAGTPLILYGRLYTQYESRIENVDTFAVEQEGSLLSKGNEVIVPASGETAEDIAVASSVRRSGIIFGGDLNVVTPVSKLDPDYIALAITYSKAHDDLAKRAQGKSVVHVHGNDIAEVEIPYPSESEQKRISTVILGLDSLITLHQ